MTLCLFVSLSLYFPAYLYECLSAALYPCLVVSLSPSLSVHVCLSVSLSVCLSASLFLSLSFKASKTPCLSVYLSQCLYASLSVFSSVWCFSVSPFRCLSLSLHLPLCFYFSSFFVTVNLLNTPSQLNVVVNLSVMALDDECRYAKCSAPFLTNQDPDQIYFFSHNFGNP